jgi:hypothetical protein
MTRNLDSYGPIESDLGYNSVEDIVCPRLARSSSSKKHSPVHLRVFRVGESVVVVILVSINNRHQLGRREHSGRLWKPS